MFDLQSPPRQLMFSLVTLSCLAVLGCDSGSQNQSNVPEASQSEEQASETNINKAPVEDSSAVPKQQSEGMLLVARAQAIKQLDPQKALELLFVASDLADSKAPALALAGEILFKTGDSKNAEGVLKAAIEADPKTPDPHRWLAAYYYDVGAMDDALFHLNQVAELDSSDPKPLRMRGMILADFERHAEAIKAYELALKRELTNQLRMEIHLELAKSLLAAREPQKALGYLKELPSIAAVESSRGEAYLAIGDLAGAEKAIETALSLDPSDARALMMKANLSREQGDIDQSVATLEKAIALHPYEFDFRFHLMSAYNRQGNKEAAAEQRVAMDRLRNLRTRFTELHHQSMQDRTSAAIRHELGVTAEALGKFEMAVSWYQAALALDPDYEAATRALQNLQIAAPDQ